MIKLRLVILGFGHVGQALAGIVLDKGPEYRRRYHLDLEVVAVADSSGAAVNFSQPASPGGSLPLAELLERKQGGVGVGLHPIYGRPGLSGEELLRTVTAEVVIEVSPTDFRTGEPALTHIRMAMERGMHVVTANKGPLVLSFDEISSLARVRSCGFKFGGAVAAALPTASIGYYELAGSQIHRLEGVLNGTTNYILTRMAENNLSYDLALQEAQSKGIAERNPVLDVEGWDTAAKLLILTNTLMGARANLEQIKREGITGLTRAHLEDAQRKNMVVKLLGVAEWKDGPGQGEVSLKLQVSPKWLSKDHPLAGVKGTEKGLTFYTDLLGKLTVIGGGSGPIPAAGSMIRDIINLAREVYGLDR
ncbi:MAG: homoserine dehydrogenase [Firmicutes bacterium]|nr:homoserine dehydrogenase [Bacillota bacterium]MCL5039438.1 homoserine dehydrogenase [Bacillota bacterium]